MDDLNGKNKSATWAHLGSPGKTKAFYPGETFGLLGTSTKRPELQRGTAFIGGQIRPMRIAVRHWATALSTGIAV
jgi:hypothetical protein